MLTSIRFCPVVYIQSAVNYFVPREPKVATGPIGWAWGYDIYNR